MYYNKNIPSRVYNDVSLYNHYLSIVDNRTLHEKLTLNGHGLKLYDTDIQNKIILMDSELGFDSISQNSDIWKIPLGDKTFGLHLHGTAIDNLIQEDFPQ